MAGAVVSNAVGAGFKDSAKTALQSDALHGLINDTRGAIRPGALIPGNASTSQNAAILGRNMAREGRAAGSGEAAGHIVPSTGSTGHWAAGARSRDLLAAYDIGINDAANGIPIGHPRPHNLMHAGAFLTSTESRLSNVESEMLEQGSGHRAIRSALRNELRAIGRKLLTAK